MTIYVCCQCKELKKACTLIQDDNRRALPIYCTPDQWGKIRVPIWSQPPEKIIEA